VMGRLNKSSEQFEDIVTTANETIHSLNESAGKVQDTLTGINKITSSINPDQVASAIANIDEASASAKQVLQSLDGEKLAKIVDDTTAVSGRLNKASEKFEDIASSADEAIRSLNETSGKVQDTLAGIDKITGAIDPDRVNSMIANIDQASRDAKVIAQDFAKVSEKIGRRADDIDQIIGNTRELAQRLNEASTRVDGILAKIDSFVSGGNGESFFAQASETLKSYKELADTLNAKMGTITDGLARFSGQGLRDVEALVRDSRRSVNRIEEAISDLQRNPQRIISGGEGEVRRYDGRVRR
jgi:phospholipid/cholesterol/gamma-HCH transport system substrate-binding protein